jgi:hypothetical protein
MPDLPKIIGKAADYAVARARDTALEKGAGTVLISTLDGRLTALSSASGEYASLLFSLLVQQNFASLHNNTSLRQHAIVLRQYTQH